MLRTLSTFLREDARTRAELETRQGWTVNAARLALASPWVVLVLLAGASSAVTTAYNRPAGALVLAIGAAASIVAYRVMVIVGRLPEERRVLHRAGALPAAAAPPPVPRGALSPLTRAEPAALTSAEPSATRELR